MHQTAYETKGPQMTFLTVARVSVTDCHFNREAQMHRESQQAMSSASGLMQSTERAFREAGSSLDSERKQAWTLFIKLLKMLTKLCPCGWGHAGD